MRYQTCYCLVRHIPLIDSKLFTTELSTFLLNINTHDLISLHNFSTLASSAINITLSIKIPVTALMHGKEC